MHGRKEAGGVSFHGRYLSLVEELERAFPVAQWRSDDLEIWPLVRMDLYNDMYDSGAGAAAPRAPRPSYPLRVLTRLATPLRNLWRSRTDLRHWVGRPGRAHAILLGDGVSLDLTDGAWIDRYGEPVMEALERRGLGTFCMQPGELLRLPWRRPTYAANLVALRGALGARACASVMSLPAHEMVQRYLREQRVAAPSLELNALQQRVRVVQSTATAFERVLDKVQPTLAFVVTYYAGLGAAYLLACRRRGVLSVDLQHCPQEGGHKAYGWKAVPATGYAALPAVFWNWTEADAADIRRWTGRLAAPWHRSLHGGHNQIADFLDAEHPRTKAWDVAMRRHGAGRSYTREILIALQPIAGRRAWWETLASQIAAAPPDWRWWIRRHPASRADQDVEFGSLLTRQAANVNVADASSIPLPALLRHMSVLLSLASGAAGEAAAFGVPALFLSEEARGPFGALIDRGLARIIDVAAVNEVIEKLEPMVDQPRARQPRIDATLLELERCAEDYARLVTPRFKGPRRAGPTA